MSAPLEGLAVIDYRGATHLLGRTHAGYAIWRLDQGGAPIALFPLTPEGWEQAWVQYGTLEDVDASSTWVAADPRALQPKFAGDLVGRSFGLWSGNFRTLFGVAAVVLIPVQGLILALSLLFIRYVPQVFPGEGTVRVPQQPLWVNVLSNVLGVLASAVLVGAIVVVVVAAVTERRATAGEALGAAFRRIGSLLWVVLLEAFAVLAPLVPGIGMVVLADSDMAGAVALIVMIAGGVIAVFLFVRLLFAPMALIVEGRRGVAALERSWSLSRGFGWRILGVLILVGLIIGAAVLVASIALVPIFLRGGLSTETLLTLFVGFSIIGLVVGVVATPMFHVAMTVLYLDARVRKEGYSVDQLEADLPRA